MGVPISRSYGSILINDLKQQLFKVNKVSSGKQNIEYTKKKRTDSVPEIPIRQRRVRLGPKQVKMSLSPHKTGF